MTSSPEKAVETLTKDSTTAESRTSANWKVPIATVLITAATTLLVGYWQFHPRGHTENSLHGHVYGKNSVNVSGAVISLDVAGEARQIRTDSDGFFRFAGMTPADGSIVVTATGYNPYKRFLTTESYKDEFEVTLVATDQQPLQPSGGTNTNETASIESPGFRPFRGRAEANMGWSYEIGEGGSPDYKSAMNWYQKAVTDGDTKASWNIGRLYEFGFGVSRDLDKAREWYQKAADKGDEEATVFIKNIGGNHPY